jgi:hypothetical protein
MYLIFMKTNTTNVRRRCLTPSRLAALALVALCSMSASLAQDWRALAVADTDALRAQIEAHTPIPFDSRAPALQRWLKEGHAQAASRAQAVSSAAGWYFTLTAFANGFGDPHIRVTPNAEPAALQWPGFVVSMTIANAVVSFRDPDDAQAPAVGTRVLQCDGKPLATLARERVLPFNFNARIALDQRDAVTALFTDQGNPFVSRIAACRFSSAGREFTAPLRWRNSSLSDLQSRIEQANSGPPASWGLSEPSKAVWWIGAPSFDDSQSADLAALIAKVHEKGDALRRARAVVVDLRGNRGGNAAWATQLAQAIFSHEVLTQHALPSSHWATDWRASAGNLAHAQSVEQDSSKRFGQFSPERQNASRVADRLAAWLNKAPPLWRDGADDLPAPVTGTVPRASGPRPFPATVYLLSNGTCASACLDFIDLAWRVPGTRLLGATTAADGLLLDVRDVMLPSGQAMLTLPQKVMRSRVRGHLQPYVPDAAYAGPWTDQQTRAWVLRMAR